MKVKQVNWLGCLAVARNKHNHATTAAYGRIAHLYLRIYRNKEGRVAQSV